MKFILWTLVWWGLHYIEVYLEFKYIGYDKISKKYDDDIRAKAFVAVFVIWILGAIYLHY